MCISGRQPFPAGDRVTFNGKECICEKCTQPVPINSTAPPQAVYSKFSVFLHCYLFPLYVTCTLLPIHFLNVCNDSPLWCFISTTLHFCLALSADCCGCGKEFKNEQSLVALDKHWHLGCFKCKVCNKVLNAEYISKLVPLFLFMFVRMCRWVLVCLLSIVVM